MSGYVSDHSPFGVLWLHRYTALNEGPEWVRRERLIVDAGATDKDHQVVATPAVFRTLPAPLRKCIGDLSRKDEALLGFDLFTPLK